MDAYRIHDMLENVSEAASTELSKGTEHVNTREFGDVVDMIKDLTEAEKNKMEACYYKTLIDAMKDHEYGEDYDEYGPIEGQRMGYPRSRDSRGRFTSNRRGMSSNREGMQEHEMWDDPRFIKMFNERMSYSNGAYGGGRRGQTQSSRYGYSHDEYMDKKSSYAPEMKAERAKLIEDHMDDLYGMFKEEVSDMTPEEKQLWKTKLNRIINL